MYLKNKKYIWKRNINIKFLLNLFENFVGFMFYEKIN